MPGSPESSTARRSPICVSLSAASSTSISWRRPTYRECAMDATLEGIGITGLSSAAKGSQSTRCTVTGSSRPFSQGRRELEFEAGPGPGQQAHHVGGEDFAPLGVGTQPRRLDHWQPEVVALLRFRLAGCHAHPDGQRLCRVGAGPPWPAASQPRRPTGPDAIEVTIKPSPRFLTSWPRASAAAARSSPKCSRRSSSAAASPRRERSSVDPTRSLNSTVTVSVAIALLLLQ